MNGRQDYAFERSRLLAGTLHTNVPTGLVMTAGNYADMSSPLLLPTPSIMRTTLPDLSRPPSAISLASSHQQYHGRCTSSFSWNSGTNFSSFLNGINFSSVSSPVSPLHSTSDAHNIRTVWSPAASNPDGVGHYCMASGLYSLFPLVSGNEMSSSFCSASSLSRCFPFQHSLHHNCHNSKDLMLSSGIHLETIMPYSQQLSHVSPSFSALNQEHTSPMAPYYAKGFESPSYQERDVWSECHKGFKSDNNNNNSGMCQTASDMSRIGMQSKELISNISISEMPRSKKSKSNKLSNNKTLCNKVDPLTKKDDERTSPRNLSASHKRRKMSDTVPVAQNEKRITSPKVCTNFSEVKQLSETSNKSSNDSLHISGHYIKNHLKRVISKEELQSERQEWKDAKSTKPLPAVVRVSAANAIVTTPITTTTTTFTTTTTTTTVLTSSSSVMMPTSAPTPCHVMTTTTSSVVSRDAFVKSLSGKKNGGGQKSQYVMPAEIVNRPQTCKKKLSPEKCKVSEPNMPLNYSKCHGRLSSVAAENELKNSYYNDGFQRSETIPVPIPLVTSSKKSVQKPVPRTNLHQLNPEDKTSPASKQLSYRLESDFEPSQTTCNAKYNVIPSEPENLSICATEELLPALRLSSSSVSLPSTTLTPTISTSSISPSYSTIAEDLWKASELMPETQIETSALHKLSSTPLSLNTDRDTCNHEKEQKIKDHGPKNFSANKNDAKVCNSVTKLHRCPVISKESARNSVQSVPCISKPYSGEKKTVGKISGSASALSAMEQNQLSNNSVRKAPDKLMPLIHPNVQKVQPIPITTEKALPLISKRNLQSSRNTNTLPKPQVQCTPDLLSSASTVVSLSLPVSTPGIPSSTGISVPTEGLQTTEVVGSHDAITVPTLPKSTSCSLSLNPTTVPFDAVNLADQTFLQTTKITPLKSNAEENLTVAQVLPINVITTNTCEKVTMPVKTQDPLPDSSIVLHNPTVSVNIPIGIAVARQRHEQTTTQTAGIVASTTPWDESSRTGVSPWISQSHTSTYWLPQGNYAATTAPFPLQFNSPDLTHLPFPPLGFQLVRDSITGHLLLIPTNIDLTDRSSLWSNYNTNPTPIQPNQQCHQIMIQQHVVQQDQARQFEYRMPVAQQLPNVETSKTQTTEMQTEEQEDIEGNDLEDVAELQNTSCFSQEKAEDKDKNAMDFSSTDASTSVQMSNTSGNHDTPYSFSYQASSDVPYDYSSTGILQLAQAVQTDSGKRSQGTSPIPLDECSPCMTEQISHTLEDSDSCLDENLKLSLEYGSAKEELPQLADASIQTDTPPPMEDDIDMNENDLSEMTLDNHDEMKLAENQDDVPVPDVANNDGDCDMTNVAADLKENAELIREDEIDVNVVDTEEKTGAVLKAIETTHDENKINEEEMLPIKIDDISEVSNVEVIALQGLELLSNSISELEDPGCHNISVHKEKELNIETVPVHYEVANNSECQITQIESVNDKSSSIDDDSCVMAVKSCESHGDSAVPESMQGLGGLGLLCALAEQCIVEENKKVELTNPVTDLEVTRNHLLHSDYHCSSPELPFEPTNEETVQKLSCGENASIAKVLENEYLASEETSGDNEHVMDFSEFEMRKRLAELQRRYKEKQRQLAKLQPKKDKEEPEKIFIKKGPGRPRKNLCPGINKSEFGPVVKTFVRLEATPPLLETGLDEQFGKNEPAQKGRLPPCPSVSILSPLKNKLMKKSLLKTPLLQTKKLSSAAITQYLKRIRSKEGMKSFSTFSTIKLASSKTNATKKKLPIPQSYDNNTEAETIVSVPAVVETDKRASERCFEPEEAAAIPVQSDDDKVAVNAESIPEISEPQQNQQIEQKKEDVISSFNSKPNVDDDALASEEDLFDKSNGLGLLAQFACSMVEEKNRENQISTFMKPEMKSSEQEEASKNEQPLEDPLLCFPSSTPTLIKKRKPGRPKKPDNSLLEANEKNVFVKSMKIEIEPFPSQFDEEISKSSPTLLLKNLSSPESSPPKANFLDDEAWNRRRSERIFLNDLNITPSGGYCDNSNKNMLSPPHLKPITEELTLWKSKPNPTKNMTHAPNITKCCKKPVKTEGSITPKKLQKDQRKQIKNPSIPDELFQAMQEKCCLNESSLDVSQKTGSETNENDNNENEGGSENNEYPDESTHLCKITCQELVEGMRVMTLMDGLFYAGQLNVIDAPDIYGIIFDGERGNRPHIYSREEILKKAILEIKAESIENLSESTRICAYWSQQYRCLYPGTVKKCTSPDPDADENSVYVEFDDGDSGRIPINDICLLPRTFPIVSYRPSPLVYTGKRRYRSESEKNSDKCSNRMKDNENQKTSSFVHVGRESSTLPCTEGETAKVSHVEETVPQNLKTTSLKIKTSAGLSVMPSLVISTKKKIEEDKKKKLKKLKPDHSKTGDKSGREYGSDALNVYGTGSDIIKTKKHKKHKARDRSEEHRHHHHHHHHHKHKHKHERHEKHYNNNEGKSKEKEPANLRIVKSFEKSGTKITAIVKQPTFTAVRKKSSELTMKIRTNSSDMSHVDIPSVVEDSETQSTWDISESASKTSNATEVSYDNVFDEDKNKTDEKDSSNKKQKKHVNRKRKRRPSSMESKSKMAAFLPARQLWRWAGNSFRRPGTKGKARKKFYKAITRGKETIVVGDCAVFLSTGRPHLPYIGRIEMMWEAWGGNMVVKVKWFYHPEETKGGRRITDLKGALYQSLHVDENDVQTISHKCEVLSWIDYKKRTNFDAVQKSSQFVNIFDNNDIYYLAGMYDPTTGYVKMEPTISS